MRRRDFLTLLGGVAAAWPLPARAQQPAMPVVGFLHNASPGQWTPFVDAFRMGLRDGGYIDGQNVGMEFRWAEGHDERMPAMAADLVSRQVTIIVTNTSGALAAKALTMTIPIVFLVGNDPVKLGLVASLNRPGGNLTGINFFAEELEAKRLGLLHELVPRAAAVAVFVNPTRPGGLEQLRIVQESAGKRGLQIHVPMPAPSGRLTPVSQGSHSSRLAP